MKNRKIIMVSVCVVIACIFTLLIYQRVYVTPSSELRQQISSLSNAIDATSKRLKDQWRVEKQLKTFADTTLGTREDQVRARLRSLLAQLAKRCELTQVVVNDSSPVLLTNPAAKLRVSEFDRKARSRPDAVIVKGDLSAVGSYEQVNHALALLQAQPWIHSFNSYQIKPESTKDRILFELHAQVSTIYLPDFMPVEQAHLAELDSDKAWLALAATNLFTKPKVVPPVQVAQNPPPPPTPAPIPYHDWRVTGIANGRAGVRIVLVKLSTGKGLSVSPGDLVAEVKATLVSGSGESAIFEIEGKDWIVNMGQTLAQRRPLKG